MNMLVSSRTSKMAAFATFVLIPVFFIYQAIVQGGWLPPVLKGYFTYGMLFSFPMVAIVCCRAFNLAAMLRSGTVLLFLTFMFMLGGLAAFSNALGVDEEIGRYIQLSFVRFIYLFLFAICLCMTGERFSRFLHMFVLAHSLFVILMSLQGGYVLPPFYYGEYIFEYDYQQVAFCYLVLSAFLLPSMRAVDRYRFYILVIPALYLIGARSEFYAFFVLVSVIEMVRNFSFYMLGAALFVSSLALFLALADLSFLRDIRMFSIFFDSADLSVDARQIYAAAAYHQISENPIIGGYGTHAPGEYAHNMFSAWVDLGVLGFFIYLSMLLAPVLRLTLSFNFAADRVDWLRAFGYLLLSIFLLCTAKTYTYGLVPVAIGMYFVFSMRINNKFFVSRT